VVARIIIVDLTISPCSQVIYLNKKIDHKQIFFRTYFGMDIRVLLL